MCTAAGALEGGGGRGPAGAAVGRERQPQRRAERRGGPPLAHPRAPPRHPARLPAGACRPLPRPAQGCPCFTALRPTLLCMPHLCCALLGVTHLHVVLNTPGAHKKCTHTTTAQDSSRTPAHVMPALAVLQCLRLRFWFWAQEFRRLQAVLGAARDREDLFAGGAGGEGAPLQPGAASTGLLLRERGALQSTTSAVTPLCAASQHMRPCT